ncbi:hypothetical protein BaRGS_00004334 [Batillaria attramentaria]|uniref:Uncharacterized protein n=1 Tax=Batillaria attramentaria TaxID=370345 RepID=A0ABD0LZM6_9CAEN
MEEVPESNSTPSPISSQASIADQSRNIFLGLPKTLHQSQSGSPEECRRTKTNDSALWVAGDCLELLLKDQALAFCHHALQS